jgi:peptidyl-prolyl cis-trans isomerase A (cyclophilin A)
MKHTLIAVILTSAALAQTQSPEPNLMDPSTFKEQAPAKYTVDLKTTKGDIIIRVTRSFAPIGADRFYNVVKAGFYTDCSFFRITGQIAQFGIHPKPEVAQTWYKATIQDDPVKEANTRGMVTFANNGTPNSRSTQVFINLVDNPDLNSNRFAPFGELTKGMELVKLLYTGYGDPPSDFQQKLFTQGKEFLDRSYPKLDRILTATIESDEPKKKK